MFFGFALFRLILDMNPDFTISRGVAYPILGFLGFFMDDTASEWKRTRKKFGPTIILKTAVGPRKKVQDFDPEPLDAGVEHSQKVNWSLD